jgi:hypothetical protein
MAEKEALRDVVKEDGMKNGAAFFEQPDEGRVRRAKATGSLW